MSTAAIPCDQCGERPLIIEGTTRGSVYVGCIPCDDGVEVVTKKHGQDLRAYAVEMWNTLNDKGDS